MNQNDYVILFDEKGTPYIAHAGWFDNAKNAARNAANAVGNAAQQVANRAKGVGRGVRTNHKYILKVNENGKTRYFYKPEEVKAYYEAKRKGIKNPAEYAQKAADAASNAVDAVKNAASKAGNAARSAFREATGQAARDRMDEAANRRDTEAANMQINKQNREASRSNVQSARQATREAEAERNRSEAALKGLKEKWKSDNEKAVDVSSKAVDALTRKYAAESKARKADLDSLLSMPWEFQKRRDAKTVQADAWREAQQAENERKALHDEHDRIDKSRELTKKAYNTELEKSVDAWNQRAQALRNQDTAEQSHQVAQDKFNESRAAYREADSDYNKNKAAYDKSLAGAVDRTAARARDAASDAREAASSAYNKAKDAANNTINNAKNAYERMKGEFRDRAEQAGNAVKEASGINARNNVKATQKALDDANTALSRAEDRWWADAKEAMAHPSDKTEAREKRSDQAWSDKAREREQADEQARDARIAYSKTPLAKAEKQVKNAIDTAKDIAGYDERERRDAAKQVTDTKRTEGQTPTVTENTRTAQTQKAYNKTPLGMIENAKNAASSAANAVQGMIDNARSSTAKAVNEAWEKIPKNADGTVNPFDPKFQSTYNDWKNRKDKYDNSLTGRAKEAAEKATDSVMDMIDQAKKAAKNTATSAQNALDNATGNNYRKRAQEANQAAENAINQRARTSDQLENQRSKYGSKTNDSDHIYGDSEGYYYKTKEQRDRAESLITKRDRYDADIVNNNRASKVNDSMYADSKAGRINSLLGRETSSTSERSNSKATEVNNKWDRQEAESKLIGGRLDPGINVSKEYVYSRASNSGMASEVSKVMKLEETMRSAERAYERLSEDSSKPQSSSRAARQKMLQAQDAYEKAYEELIDNINDQYDQDLAEYERRYGKYNRG